MKKASLSSLKICVPRERSPLEKRVAISPETVKKILSWGGGAAQVFVEQGAGKEAFISDAAYEQAGAILCGSLKELYKDAHLILKVRRPLLKEEGEDELSLIPKGATVVGLLGGLNAGPEMTAYAEKDLRTFSLELVPRITRAQGMDVLSSQSNLAGYRAVIEAAALIPQAFPLMMTAAGTVAPVRVLVIGAGVAGLQAIATARRLGAIVMAFDVRAAAKEQVESLGAQFIQVESDESGEDKGGYAKEMSKSYQDRQAKKLQEVLAKTDIVICTALIPGKPAPRIISASMLSLMKPGSVVIDLAAESGGNCEGSEPEKSIIQKGVQIVGSVDLPSRVSADASALYARNIFNFIELLWDRETKCLIPHLKDEILKATCLTDQGKTLLQGFQDKKESSPSSKPSPQANSKGKKR